MTEPQKGNVKAFGGAGQLNDRMTELTRFLLLSPALHKKCSNRFKAPGEEEIFLPQSRKGAKKTPQKRGSALRLCAFAREIFSA
jgi:hypothetical protein